jgi:hypothetical protein
VTLPLFFVNTDRCWRGVRSTTITSPDQAETATQSGHRPGNGGGKVRKIASLLKTHVLRYFENGNFLCDTVFLHKGSMLLCKCVNSAVVLRWATKKCRTNTTNMSTNFWIIFLNTAHICTLLGYGVDAICPYLVYETVSRLRDNGLLTPPLSDEEVFDCYQAACATRISKVMAKMGISTLHSYKVCRPVGQTRVNSGRH